MTENRSRPLERAPAESLMREGQTSPMFLVKTSELLTGLS